MNWFSFVENPKALNDFFDTAPSLKNVEVVSLVVDRDGPSVSLHLAINETPTKFPARLKKQNPNAISLRLQLLGVETLTLEGWATDNPAKVNIEAGVKTKVAVHINGPTMQLNCSCQWIRIEGITAYRREPQSLEGKQSCK